MTDDQWAELEFDALRAELLALGQAERSAMKFYIPAASTVYAVPYILLRQEPSALVDPEEALFLWTLCATVAGLLTLAMVQSLFWSVDGARRIGMYIKEGIEPRTHRGLRWETTLYQLHDQKRFLWPSEPVTIGTSTLFANLVAAFAAGMLFLDDTARLLPLLAAGLVSTLALPPLWRMARPSKSRKAYSVTITKLMANAASASTPGADVVAPKLNITGDAPSVDIMPRDDSTVVGERVSRSNAEKMDPEATG